jgi:hypothetical protein
VDEIFRSKPERLVRLLPGDQAEPALWQGNELADILRHQLAASLPPRPPRPRPTGDGDDAVGEDEPAAGSPDTFGGLLRHPSPPLELLRLAKSFAKTADSRRDEPIPAEIATVLYYATVVAGLLRHGVMISSLDADAIQQGVNWALARPWLDSDLRHLFREWSTRHGSGTA